MKSKKGILLERNTLSAVFAVAGLLILSVGFIAGCSRLVANEETEAAKDTLNAIRGKIDALEVGKKTKPLIKGVADGWYLKAWGKNEIDTPDVDACFLNSCICVCKGTSAAICAGPEGFCRQVKDVDEIKVVSPYLTEKMVQGKSPIRTGTYFENEGQDIYLYNEGSNLLEIEFEKIKAEDDKISLKMTHYSKDYLEKKKDIVSNE